MSSSDSTELYGPFEVHERLGIGGMATVHRAIERGIEGFQRVVALKRLLPHLAEDEAFVRAFVREAKLASLLQHGNIAQLYELGRVGASYFISMEYVHGRDVRRILRQAKRTAGPPPVPVALAILSELLDALDYAHTRTDDDGAPLGLVHRDISPSNLILARSGHLKVIDFGIAKATPGHLATNTGRIKGKLSYMAPEALTGRLLDNRSDLFSASIIAHELLTAHPLFAAGNDFHTIERVQEMEAPPPSLRNHQVPAALDAVVLRGLAKDASRRWRSAAEMRGALADIIVRDQLHCTNREVADWVAVAFAIGDSQDLPARPAAVALDESTDEILDLIWEAPPPGAPVPIIIEGVPDVSDRIIAPPAASTEVDAGPAREPVPPRLVSRVPGIPPEARIVYRRPRGTSPPDADTAVGPAAVGVPRPPRVPLVVPRPASAAPAAAALPRVTAPARDISGTIRLPLPAPTAIARAASQELPSVMAAPAPTAIARAASQELPSVMAAPAPPVVAAVPPATARRRRPATTPGEWAAGTSPETTRPAREALLGTRTVQVWRAGIVVRSRAMARELLAGVGPRRLFWFVAGVSAVALVWAAISGSSSSDARAPAGASSFASQPESRTPVQRAASSAVAQPRAAAAGPPAAVPAPQVSPLAVPPPAPAPAQAKSPRPAEHRSASARRPAPPAPPALLRPAPPAPAAATPSAPPLAPSLIDGEVRPLPVPIKPPPIPEPAGAAKR